MLLIAAHACVWHLQLSVIMCAWFILTQGASLNVEPNTVDTTVGELNGEIIR